MRFVRTRNNARATVLLGMCVLFLTITSSDAAQWGGRNELIDGIPNVLNPEKPLYPAETVKTQELWRIGGDEDEEEEIIGFVTDAFVDDQDNSYLLDATMNVIRVYGSDGTFLREIGGAGDGPGEFNIASQFMLMPNQYIGVVQMMPAKIVTLDREGIPGGHFSLGNGGGGMRMVRRAAASDHSVVIGMVSPSFQDGSVVTTHSLAIVDPDGEVKHTIIEAKEEQHGGNISIGGSGNEFTNQWSVGRDGSVYVTQHNHDYKIEVFNAEGTAERVICREYDTLKRLAADIAADEEQNAEMAQRFSGSIELEVPQYERDINTVYPRPDGKLWVSTSRGIRNCPAGAIGTFDVYDAEGKFVRQLSIEVDYNPERDQYVLTDDRLFILKEAQMRPASTSTSGGGGTMMVMMSGGSNNDDDDDTDTGAPPGVVCYKLDL